MEFGCTDFGQYLHILACPKCKGDLTYQAETTTRSLSCAACDKSYPIINDIPRLLEVDSELLGEAKNHWESSPHFQYEANNELYSRDYYEEQDRWREEEVDIFRMAEYRFDTVKGKVTLDIGCGSGWVVKQSARHGAFSIGVDFTEKAAISTYFALKTYGLTGLAIQADAQHLPIKTGSIDRVYSMGVLHHIPNTELGISEAYRIVKPGGTAMISLYERLFFFNPFLFPFAQLVLKRLLKAPKVRDGIQHTTTYDEFYRLMDGPTNPIGRWYTYDQLVKMFSQFVIHHSVRNHFPLRFLRIGSLRVDKLVPKFIHHALDRWSGMTRMFELEKK